VWARVYSRFEFDTDGKAADLFDFLEKEGGIFNPAYFGQGEPVRRRYAGNRRMAIEMLTGAPKGGAGAVYLKGSAHDALSVFRWVESRLSRWEFYLDEEFLSTPDRVDEFLQFITRLSTMFPFEFGWAAPKEDWEAKHWKPEFDDTGRAFGSTKLGDDIEHGLPGLYWLTIFGPELLRQFQPSFVAGLPVHKVLNLGNGARGITVRKLPYKPPLPERLSQDRQVIQALGSQYFFDIAEPGKKIQTVLGAE
jgi:hypothetical protein